MENHNKLIGALWSEFTELIESGVPVYFTFTNDLVEEILSRDGISFDSGRDAINNAVSDLIEVYGDHVHLKRNALMERKGGFSAAILFVCQQILAVEEMTSTELHSENAYFPHLRKNLSSELYQISQNPFNYDDFGRIWLTLSKEIFKISHTPKCITFSFEITYGANKAKRFPLSQALFSKEDVIRLIDKIGFKSIRSDDEEYVYRCITSNRHVLSGRGKRLITYVWMKDALVRQVKSISQSIGVVNRIRQVVTNKTVALEDLVLKVSMDNIDWFENEYVINLFDSNNNLISDISTVNDFFREKVSNKNYSVFVPSKDGDCWMSCNEEYAPSSKEELIVLYNNESKEAIKSLISDYFDVSKDNIIEERISRAKSVNAFRLVVGEFLNKSIYIKCGDLCIDENKVSHTSVSFKGGVLVNLKQDRYSALFLPTHIVIDDCEYELVGNVTINGSIHDFDNFRVEVKNILINLSYTIELNEEIKFTLKVAPQKRIIERKVIYRFYKKQLLPIQQVVDCNSEEAYYENLHPHHVGKKVSELLKDNRFIEAKKYLDTYQLV